MLVGVSGEEEAGLEQEQSVLKPLQSNSMQQDGMNKRRASRLRWWQSRFLWGWAIHFTVTFMLVLYGICANGGTV